MRSRLTRTAAGALALGIATFTLVGCGDDSTGSSTKATTSESAPVTEAAAAATGDTMAPAAEGEAADAGLRATSASRSNILYTAVGAGNFLTLARLLGIAGLLDTVKDGGPFTVFAPTDEAFAKVPAETLAALAADKDKLTKVLLYHVVPGTLTADKLATGELKTAEGSTLKITVDGTVKADDATVVAADVLASNGVIHVVDSVVLPPDL